MSPRYLIRFSRSVTVAFGIALTALGATGQAVGLSSKPKPIALTNDQIPAALLTLNDFPTGWSNAPEPEPNTASATGGICNGPTALARAQDARVVGYGSTRFTSNPSQGPYVAENLYSFPSDNRAKAFVKATSKQASACTTAWAVTPIPPGLPAGATARNTIAVLAFPRLVGDQVVAARVTETEQLNGQDVATNTTDQVLIRKGNHALGVAYIALSPDVNQLQTYARKAYSRFTDALQNARAQRKGS